MSGPQHYKTAEVLLANLTRTLPSGADLYTPDHKARIIAQAQAHATLALTAATAHAVESRGAGDIAQEWREVIWP